MLEVSTKSCMMQPSLDESTNENLIAEDLVKTNFHEDTVGEPLIVLINNDVSLPDSELNNQVMIETEEEGDDDDDFSDLIQDMIDEGLSDLGYPAAGVGQVFLNLNLSGKDLGEVDFLSKFEHLQVLDVSNNNLTDLNVLGNFHHLISLNASNNDLTEIIASNPPLRLREMNYSNNNIKEIGDISCHSSLNTLLLDFNHIEEITGLENCRSLRNLSISNNNIKKISGIDGLRLKQLDLGNNAIRKIENIQNLKIIQYINLSGNSIRSMRGLQEHLLLEDVNLENNQNNFEITARSQPHCCEEILDISEIRYLRDLRLLRVLSLSQNPIQSPCIFACAAHPELVKEDLRRRYEMIMETVDYRLSTIFKLPMLVELDLVPVYPEEKVAANNVFNPSAEVIAARDHMYNVMKYFLQPQKLLDSTLPNYEPYPMLVIAGPIGVGKKVLSQKLCQEFPSYFENCVVHTTRDPCSNPMRSMTSNSEQDGVDYNFVTADEFAKLRSEGYFLQTCTKHGHQYGVSRESIEKASQSGLACVLTMELQGVMSLKQTHYEPRCLLILPRDEKVYKNSLQDSNRYTESQIDQGLIDIQTYIETHREKPGYFDSIIVTDDFDERYEELKRTVINYLGLLLPNTSTAGSVLSLLSRKSTSRPGTSSRDRSSSCKMNNDSSAFNFNEYEPAMHGRTAACVSYERRFEDTKSAIVGMTSFDEQIAKVRDQATPNSPIVKPSPPDVTSTTPNFTVSSPNVTSSSPNVIPHVEGCGDITRINKQTKSHEKETLNITADEDSSQSGFTPEVSVRSSTFSMVTKSDHITNVE